MCKGPEEVKEAGNGGHGLYLNDPQDIVENGPERARGKTWGSQRKDDVNTIPVAGSPLQWTKFSTRVCFHSRSYNSRGRWVLNLLLSQE